MLCEGTGLNTRSSDGNKPGLTDPFWGDWGQPWSDGSDSLEGVSDNVLDRRVFFGGASFFGVEWNLRGKKVVSKKRQTLYVKIFYDASGTIPWIFVNRNRLQVLKFKHGQEHSDGADTTTPEWAGGAQTSRLLGLKQNQTSGLTQLFW